MNRIKRVKVTLMTSDISDTRKDNVLNLRIDSVAKEMIDYAADISGQSRSSFMISAAKQKAEEILLSQTQFALDEESWKRFNAALDGDLQPNVKLDNFFAKTPEWQ